jgi:hypothetical protein
MRVIFCYNWYKDSKFVSPPMDWKFDRIASDLTIEKEYLVLASNDGRYLVTNDRGFLHDYPMSLFTTLDEIRDNKLKEIGI